MAEQTRIKEIQIGNVGATVWDHGTAATPRRSVTFYRLYTHGIQSGRLRNFGLDDLLLLSVVADRTPFRLRAFVGRRGTGETRGRGREVGPAG